MDKVSPAIALGVMEKVDAGSWEDNSSQSSTCQSPSCGGRPTASELDQPEVYSVATIEGNPDRSRDSTEEPLTPPGLEVIQVSDAGIAEGGEESSNGQVSYGILSEDQSLSVNAVDSYGGGYNSSSMMEVSGTTSQSDQGQQQQQPMVQEAHSTHVTSTSSPTSSAVQASGERPAAKMDICGGAMPACMSFGTRLPLEKQDQNIAIALEGAELWHQFYQAGTEMIITKSGRRMFPGIVVSVGGMDPELKYSVALEFNPVDNARYKYINTKWVNIGKAEAHCEDLLKYMHPESPSSGKHWMSSKISFKKIKVTNNKSHKRGQVVALNSMHKYQPRVVIYRFMSKKNQVAIFTHDLVECTFIGVTAYQNDHVTQLKIDNNPFAKAFRENGSDNESYGFGMSSNPWPPMSPIVSPYGTFSPDSQGSLPTISPSCIPSAGGSPLPQFNAAFTNWETQPYSPTAAAASYRAPFSNTGLTSPLFPDHRQILSSRLIAQESPPISPLLYSPTGYAPLPAHPHQNHTHQVPQLPMQTSASLQLHQQHPYGTTALAASNTTIMQQQQQQQHPQQSLQQQQQLVKPAAAATSMGEIWPQKNEYMIVAYDGAAAGSSNVAYHHHHHHHPENPQGYMTPVPKIEVDSSPVSINMDVPQ